jgi:PKD repeat protein
MIQLRNIIVFLFTSLGFVQVYGQSASFTKNVTEACDSLTVTFTNTSNLAGKTVTYEWNFGKVLPEDTEDKKVTVPDNRAMTIKYKKSGIHVVKLTMIASSVNYTFTDNVQVRPHPNAYFVVSDTFAIANFTYLFRSANKPDNSITYKYNWDLNDIKDYEVHNSANENSIRDTMIVQFATEGINIAKLTVTDGGGCIDTFSTRFYVSEKLHVPKAFAPDEAPLRVLTNGRTTYSFQVFNSAGVLVYKSESTSIIWDGYISSGSKALNGTYFYVIQRASGEEVPDNKPVHGFFMLFRK